MSIDRRRLIAALAGAATAATPTLARGNGNSAPRLGPGIDAAALGLQPNAADDQSKALQRAIDRAAAEGAALQLRAGTYRAGALQLPPNAAISGIAGATRIVMSGGASLLSATGSDNIALRGLVFDGANIPLPEGRGLIHLAQGRALRIADCEIAGAGRNGISLEAVEGEVTGNTINAAKTDHGPSWRMVVQMGKEIEAYGIYPGGQSGNPGSPHYADYIQDWAAGTYYRLQFLPMQIQK